MIDGYTRQIRACSLFTTYFVILHPHMPLPNALTLVMPVYNEAEALPFFLPNLMAECQERDWLLVIVNDGSKDATATVLEQWAYADNLTIVHHKVNRGYGAALKTGLAQVQTEYLVTLDGDGQHRLEDAAALLMALQTQNADMVVGNRGRGQPGGLYRSLGRGLIRGVTRLLLPLPIQDLNSGMKLYRTSLAQKYSQICPNSMAFSDIITLLFISQGHLVIEQPITVQERVAGRSTINTYTAFDTLMEIVNIIMLINPQRIFLPAALLFVLAGVGWGLPIVLAGRGVSVGAMLSVMTGIICFFLGLVAEQLAQIRKDKIQ